MSEAPLFLIVTPTFHSAETIDQTILSVVSQSGAFRIRYHLQDGGSTDGTLEKLERWRSLLASASFPVLCAGVEFSFGSERDGGMYDAINRGFAGFQVSGPEYMTYINADDLLLPGTLQFAASVFGGHPEIQWLGGRPCEMNERGELMRIHEEQVYPAASLVAGLHDGRTMRFVMQEGTFWRACLWNKAGGFRTSLRQAGDWDLWRRFASETRYVTTDVNLAAHRRREGQLTADRSVYYREIDQVIREEIPELHASESARYQQWVDNAEDSADRRYHRGILRFQLTGRRGGRGEWTVEERPYQTILKPTAAVTNGFTHVMLGAEFESGFGVPGTAVPVLNLPAGYRMTSAENCSFRFYATKAGLHRIFLRCRNIDPGVRLRLANAARTILNAEIPMTSHDRDCLVIAESIFQQGVNVISMTISGEASRATPVLAIVSCEAMATV